MDKPVILYDDDVVRLLPQTDIKGELKRMFRTLAEGRSTQPPQTLALFPGAAGDFITYLGVAADEQVFGAKLSPYIAVPGKAVVTAWTLLLSMQSGQPLLLCDSKRLTTERTAATTAIALDELAPEDASVLAIVGTGAVGLAHLRYVESLRPWREVRLCSPSVAGKSGLPSTTAKGAPVHRIPDVAAATEGADAVLLCTSSGTPVFDPASLKPGALVTSISTNVAEAHEVDITRMTEMDVYCDYRATTPRVAGEMKLATEAGLWNTQALRGDLPELLAGSCSRPSGDRPIFFRSVGLGLEDIAAATAVLKALRASSSNPQRRDQRHEDT